MMNLISVQVHGDKKAAQPSFVTNPELRCQISIDSLPLEYRTPAAWWLFADWFDFNSCHAKVFVRHETSVLRGL